VSLLFRRAGTADAAEICRVHVATWKVAYRGLVDDDYLDTLETTQHVDGWKSRLRSSKAGRTVIALEGKRVLGFVTYGPARHESKAEGVGELYSLYVDPKVWGRGVGAALYARCRAGLREAGFGELIVWAMQGHEQSQGFYRARGLVDDDGRKQDHPPGGIVLELRRLRGPIDQPQALLSARWLRRACLRAAVVGGALAVFPGLPFSLGADSVLPSVVCLALGLSLVVPSLFEGAWRSRVGRRDAMVGAVATLAALLGTLGLAASFLYTTELWSSGDLTQAFKSALLMGASRSNVLLGWAFLLFWSCPWSLMVGASALGDLGDWGPHTARVVFGLLVGLPFVVMLIISLATGAGPVALLVGVVAGMFGAMAIFGTLLLRIAYDLADWLEQWLWPLWNLTSRGE
jgi:L-amino acid N-acyltransferase YncA